MRENRYILPVQTSASHELNSIFNDQKESRTAHLVDMTLIEAVAVWYGRLIVSDFGTFLRAILMVREDMVGAIEGEEGHGARYQAARLHLWRAQDYDIKLPNTSLDWSSTRGRARAGPWTTLYKSAVCGPLVSRLKEETRFPPAPSVTDKMGRRGPTNILPHRVMF